MKPLFYLDRAKLGDKVAQARVDIMTPVVKSWCTDNAVEVASLGVQVHGGMGFVEETGAAQYYRDARILPIYEGTNGIQANDLLFRKVLRDKGEALHAWKSDMIGHTKNPALQQAIQVLENATQAILKKIRQSRWCCNGCCPIFKFTWVCCRGCDVRENITS
jgi:hypothetical protein